MIQKRNKTAYYTLVNALIGSNHFQDEVPDYSPSVPLYHLLHVY
nr:hypothetical protein [Vaccinia virus]